MEHVKYVRRTAGTAGLRQACMAVMVLMLASAPAMARNVPDARIDQLTDLVVEMFPVGSLFEGFHADPDWPLQSKADKASRKQLACMRSELSTDGFRRGVQQRVQDYSRKNPSRIDSDIKLLNAGAADSFKKFAGITTERRSAEDVAKSMDAGEMMSFMTLMFDPQHAPLRELIGFGETFDMSGSEEEKRKAGEQFGKLYAMRLMLGAMETCEVPPSIMF